MVAAHNGHGPALDPGNMSIQELMMLWNHSTQNLAQAARTDFNDFIEYVMRDENGLPMRQAMHHRVWQVHISYCWEVGIHPGIMAPWAHGKTVQCVIGMAAYLLGQNPNLRIKIVCNNHDKAKERVSAIGQMITQNEYYRHVFPWVQPIGHERSNKYQRTRWTSTEIYVKRSGNAIDPSIQAAGVLTGGIGGRADVIIFDDVVDQRNAIDNEAMRDKVIQSFGRVWMSRLEPHGRVIYIGTPWHQADLSHELYKRPQWCVLRMYVSSDYQQLNQEVYNMPEGYPLPKARGREAGKVSVFR